ncbi:sulfatase-like hydrolase/transferase [Aquisphaera insulae]|uniref:sulfatase-like hydrolase/transferase n=1 Tax=Aquisphaera insulae TaxID=2712864 RepID=UPI0013EC9085|nr:sulfatase-like hydrolase/transferase [Aquisphaera insulae]
MDDDAPSKAADGRPATPRLTLSVALVLAIWLGFLAGYLDLALIIFKKLAINKEGSFRTARDFPWTVPLGHVALMLALGVVVAVLAWIRPRRPTLRGWAWLMATVALWGALLRLSLHPGASLVLAFGIGKLIADLVADRGFGLRVGWVRKSLAGFACLLIVCFAASTGRRMIGEARAVAALPPRPASAPNVVFLVWDTVRNSSLSLYGYRRETTPNLKRWAERGVVFDMALSPSPWTYPSHASYFTGSWPFEINAQWKFSLDTPRPTIAEFLKSRGYQTAGFVGNTNSCNYETALDRGFIHYDDYALTPRSLLTRTVPGKWMLEQLLLRVDPFERKWAGLQARGAEGINASFLKWLDGRRTDRPFFAFLNFFDAHEPYIPPDQFAGRFGVAPKGVKDYQALIDYVGVDKGRLTPQDLDLVRDSYENCIAYLDEQFGRMMDDLEKRGVLENTIVVLTSDHGEGFGEHGVCGHAYSVEIQEVGVPLMVIAPGLPRGRRELTAVGLRDLAVTLTDLLGFGEDSPFPGRSLAAYWNAPAGQAPPRPTSPALSEKADQTAFPSPHGEGPGGEGLQFSLVSSFGVQYVRNGDGTEMIFNLWRDPQATFNLAGFPDKVSMLSQHRSMLLEALKGSPASTEVEDAYMAAYRDELANLVQGTRPVGDPPPAAEDGDSGAAR